jgi:hypothetical protein
MEFHFSGGMQSRFFKMFAREPGQSSRWNSQARAPFVRMHIKKDQPPAKELALIV